VIEANPNPWLAPEAELAMAAAASGRDYPKLIGEIGGAGRVAVRLTATYRRSATSI